MVDSYIGINPFSTLNDSIHCTSLTTRRGPTSHTKTHATTGLCNLGSLALGRNDTIPLEEELAKQV